MKQILIIEDDKKLNDGIRLALRKDYSCAQAFSLQSARRDFMPQQFDLLLLDINFSDGSGLDYLAELRKECQVPVILLTANSMEMDIVSGLELGANDYITKPFSLAVLRAVGISITMVREIMIFENEILGCIAILAAYLVSWPVLGYLYSISEMELYGYHFFFDDRAFLWISGAALLLCGMLSGRILTEWKSKRIMEGIGKVE